MESALTTTMDMAASRGRTEGIAAEEFDHIVRVASTASFPGAVFAGQRPGPGR